MPRSIALMLGYIFSIGFVILALNLPLPHLKASIQEDLPEEGKWIGFDKPDTRDYKIIEKKKILKEQPHPNPNITVTDEEIVPKDFGKDKEIDPNSKLGEFKNDLKGEDLGDPLEGMDLSSHPARYLGGTKNLGKQLENNLEYPEMLKMQGLQGQVVVDCIVGADGRVLKVMLVKGFHPAANQDVKSACLKLKDFQPAKCYGELCVDTVRVPVRYILK